MEVPLMISEDGGGDNLVSLLVYRNYSGCQSLMIPIALDFSTSVPSPDER